MSDEYPATKTWFRLMPGIGRALAVRNPANRVFSKLKGDVWNQEKSWKATFSLKVIMWSFWAGTGKGMRSAWAEPSSGRASSRRWRDGSHATLKGSRTFRGNGFLHESTRFPGAYCRMPHAYLAPFQLLLPLSFMTGQ